MDFFEFTVRDVGIDLSGRDVGVAEHFLNGTKIGAVHKQIGRKLVAELVRGDVT